MQDFQRAYRDAGNPGATAGLDIVTTDTFDKRVAIVHRPPNNGPPPPPPHPRRRRGSAARTMSSSSSSYSDPTPWFSRDSEAKRRRRVASYKAYGVESNLKDAVRRGLRWMKARYIDLVHRR